MRWVERGALAAALIFAGLAHADAPRYGKVETFQPGKKYHCVPTPDHKAWDCNESGKASEPRAETAAPPAPAPAPATDTTAESAPKGTALPSYLKNSAQRGQAHAVAPALAPAPAHASAPVPAPTPAPPEPTPAAVPASAPAAVPAPTAPPVARAPAPEPITPAPEPTAPAPAPTAVAEPPAPVSPSASSNAGAPLGNRGFLALPASSYIVEIAHSANRADLAALHASLHLPRGELYELHLTRDGGDWWLLVWGPFSDIESARAARSDVPSDATVIAGWPRRIAPLQAEARRFND